MPFDGLEFSRHAPALPTSNAGFGGWGRLGAESLGKRWRAMKLWVLLGARGSGIEALDRSEAADLPDAGVARLLMSAAALIEPEGKWIQGAYRTFGGRYCAMGALQAAGLAHGHATRIRARRLLTAVARARGFATVERLNDASTHAGVRAAFDAAIAAALTDRMASYNCPR